MGLLKAVENVYEIVLGLILRTEGNQPQSGPQLLFAKTASPRSGRNSLAQRVTLGTVPS